MAVKILYIGSSSKEKLHNKYMCPVKAILVGRCDMHCPYNN